MSPVADDLRAIGHATPHDEHAAAAIDAARIASGASGAGGARTHAPHVLLEFLSNGGDAGWSGGAAAQVAVDIEGRARARPDPSRPFFFWPVFP